jgi:hypothetical protein
VGHDVLDVGGVGEHEGRVVVLGERTDSLVPAGVMAEEHRRP